MKICVLIAVAATLGAQAPVSSELPPDTVVLKVGGKDITAGEIRKILDSAPSRSGAGVSHEPHRRDPKSLHPGFPERGRRPVETRRREPLEKEQIEEARKRVVAQAMINHERDGYLVTPEETEAFYKANQSRYEQAKIKVIYIAYKAAMPVGTSPEDVKQAALAAPCCGALILNSGPNPDAKTLATDIVIKLRGGADFGQMVSQYSGGCHFQSRGRRLWNDQGHEHILSRPDQESGARIEEAGEVSDPVQLPGAYYIIRVDEKDASIDQ